MTTTPVMTERARNLGWIASTPTDHPWRIAVFGADEQEALDRFAEAIKRWEELPDGVTLDA